MSFSSFSFHPHIAKAIERCGFTTPTPIQQQAIQPIIERRDLLGLAQTGTGKTAAFMLPTIQHLLVSSAPQQVRVLILAPTRELAEQIHTFNSLVVEQTKLRSIAVYGGVSKNVQIARLRAGVDIVVACPGRLLDILNDRAIDLSRIETLILDEADHMFDKGFLPDIRKILAKLPEKRQSLVFSATMPQEIRHLAENILRNPVKVQINPTRPVKGIAHSVYGIEQAKKPELLIHLLRQEEMMTTTLVFTRTKHKAKSLANRLEKEGFKATSLQGNLSQNRRQQALDGFKSGTYNILVATDIAARGIDVTGISHVVNFDVPDTAEAYIHRTGRTGRACRSGEAYTFVTSEDTKILRDIERTLDGPMHRQAVTLPYSAPVRQEPAPRPGERQAVLSQAKKTTASPGQKPRRSNSPGKGIFGLRSRSRN
ncbi:MAG: DEAD/DEAH box helicase [Desulforhopalus sp.]|jgi:superfamily II DNA/RNA helicase|nr:DEAD/DEAH box helicase [Desulforhopalus sp.]